MPSFDKLYKRTSTGAIQTWWQEVDGNKFRTHSGQLEGKVTVSEWTVVEPKNVGKKNETSAEQQAVKEVESAYKLKLKSNGYFRDVSEIDNKSFSPMLAEKYDDVLSLIADALSDNSKTVFVQPKLDGIRANAYDGQLISKKQNPIVSCPHIQEYLELFHKKFPNIILDGELYNHTLKNDFDTIASIVMKKKLTETEKETSKKYIQYCIYDIFDKDNPNMSFAERHHKIHEELSPYLHDPCIELVETYQVNSHEEVNSIYEELLSDGFEGQMIRIDPTPYKQKRIKQLIKRKEFTDEEFIVVDIVEGKGNRSGMAGKAVVSLPDGRTFDPDIKGNRDELRFILQNKHRFIGKEATVKFFKYTPDGIPRFPKVKFLYEEERM